MALSRHSQNRKAELTASLDTLSASAKTSAKASISALGNTVASSLEAQSIKKKALGVLSNLFRSSFTGFALSAATATVKNLRANFKQPLEDIGFSKKCPDMKEATDGIDNNSEDAAAADRTLRNDTKGGLRKDVSAQKEIDSLDSGAVTVREYTDA